MKPERDRVKALLTEAVTLLCKNSVTYQAEVEVEGLLGITVDKQDVFLVSLKEVISKRPPEMQLPPVHMAQQQPAFAQHFTSPHLQQQSPARRKRRRKSNETPAKQMKMTPPPPQETSDPIVLEDDDEAEGSNGTVDYEHNATENQSDSNPDSSQPNPEATVTEDPAENDEKATQNNPADTKASINSVKQEHYDSFPMQADGDSAGVVGFEAYDPEMEEKWSASMGMMNQTDPSVLVAPSSYDMSQQQSSSVQQSPNTQWRKKAPKGKCLSVLSHNDQQCVDCHAVFLNAPALLQHQLDTSHMGRVCTMCKKAFADTGVLKRHIRAVHGSQSFSCQYCGSSYNRRDNFRQHQLSVHKLLTCELCNKIYNDFRELRAHIAAEHKK